MSTNESEVRLPRRIDALRVAKRMDEEQKRRSREASNQALIDAAKRAKQEAYEKRIRILKHLCNGLLPKQIARLENMPLQTVRHDILKLRKQSGAKSREQLGVWALKSGHVKLDNLTIV